MKGLQATTRLWGNVALNAVQDAIAPTIRNLMIKGTIAIKNKLNLGWRELLELIKEWLG